MKTTPRRSSGAVGDYSPTQARRVRGVRQNAGQAVLPTADGEGRAVAHAIRKASIGAPADTPPDIDLTTGPAEGDAPRPHRPLTA